MLAYMDQSSSLTKISFSVALQEGGSGVVHSLNPTMTPGVLFAAGVVPGRQELGGKLASTLAVEAFFSDVQERTIQELSTPQRCIESAFRRANTAVYEFGHKLAASGRMAASLIGLGVVDGEASAGRVGLCEAYLYRGYELFPFFESPPKEHEWYVGSSSLISVQLSSIQLQEFDTLILLGKPLSAALISPLLDFLEEKDPSSQTFSETLLRELFTRELEQDFIATVSFGSKGIFLK